jgi:hypothetical protein
MVGILKRICYPNYVTQSRATFSISSNVTVNILLFFKATAMTAMLGLPNTPALRQSNFVQMELSKTE